MFWLLVSGSFDWQHLAFGAIVAALIAAFWHHASERVVGTISPRRIALALRAMGALAKEVWLAAWQVVPLVLAPTIKVTPTLVKVSSVLRSRRMLAFYANSITLTPGTLTIELEGDQLLVHALTEKAAHDVVTWSFEHTLKRLEVAR